MATPETAKKNILDLFIDGARNGFKIGTTSLLPNVIMAFVIIRILDVTGLLHIIGVVCAPSWRSGDCLVKRQLFSSLQS